MNAPATASAPRQDGPSLFIEGLCCVRDDRVLFEDLDFRVAPGEVFQLEGPNGAGKTTLLRAVCGLAPIEAGTVWWGDAQRETVEDEFRAALTYIGHVPGVKRDLTPRENLAAARALGATPAAIDDARALERVGLAGLEDTPLRRLSAGQGRRVALARLVAAPTPLWVLDEPLTALDSDGKALLEHLVAAHVAGGGLTLISTHHPLDLAGVHARGLRLGDGGD